MATENDRTADGGPADGHRTRPEPPIIDLDAVEVPPREPAADDIGAAGADADVPPAAGPSPDEVAGPAAADAPPAPSAGPDRPRTVGVAALVAAAVLGGVVALAGGFGLVVSGVVQPPAPVVDTAAIEARLRADLAAMVPPDDLAGRVTSLEQTVGAATAGDSELAGLKAGLDRLTGDAAALRTDLTTLADRPAVDPARMADVESRLADVENAIPTLRTASDGLAGRVGAIEQRLASGPKGGEIAALSLAVTSLGSRIAAGLPFTADVEVVAAAAPDLPEVADLRRLARDGVPTIEQLIAGMPVSAMMANRPVDPSAGLSSSLLSGLKSLVNYRESGSAAGDPASRAVDAVSRALRGGRPDEARAAVDGLPDWARAVAGDWIAGLDRRVAADKAVGALTARLLDRLRQPADGQ